MKVQITPKDRRMTKEQYRSMRRFLRWYFWKHHTEIDAKIDAQMKKYISYGTAE